MHHWHHSGDYCGGPQSQELESFGNVQFQVKDITLTKNTQGKRCAYLDKVKCKECIESAFRVTQLHA